MSLNATKIDYLTHTWNITPGCSKGCPYCWARRLYAWRGKCRLCRDFVPHLHPERLKDVMGKKPARIGVSFTGDLFDPATGDTEVGYHCQGPIWNRVLDAMDKAPWHTYVILTKRPDLMVKRFASRGIVPHPNWWLCTSIANQADADERIPEILKLKAHGWPVVGVSYEPALGPVDFHRYAPLDWVIVGGLTGQGKRTDAQAVMELNAVASGIHGALEMGVPLFVKKNVNWPQIIQEYPK